MKRLRIRWQIKSGLAALSLILAAHTPAAAQRESIDALFERGIEALSDRRLDEAITAFQRCLQLSSHHPTCAYNLACAYSLKRDLPAAVQWLEHAADWGYEDVEHMLEDSDLANVRTDAGFWRVVEGIQKRLPASASRQPIPPPEPDRGQELVVMLRSELGSGAGIIISHDGDRVYVVTAEHVVRRGTVEARNIDAQLKALTPQWQRARLLPARPDTSLDVALLAIDGITSRQLRFCDLPLHLAGGSSDLQRGAKVYPVGYPGGILWAMPLTADRVSQVLPSQVSFESQFIRVGFSGGALLNERGEVVGMITADEPPLARALPIGVVLDAARKAGYPIELGGGMQATSRPLHAAAKAGDLTAMKRLLDGCADANALDANGRTPLHEAAAHGSGEAVRMLLAAGGRRNAWAVLDSSGSQIEWGTPLHFAARYGTKTVAAALLDGGDVELETLVRFDDDREISQWRSALHIAAEYDNADAAAALLAAGAAQDSAGDTPLAVAAVHGSVSVAKLLLDHGAPVQPRSGVPPLNRAAAAGKVAMLELLVERGADVNAKGEGPTALHSAAREKQVEAAAFLIAHKADVNAPGYVGNTPLHDAAENGSAAIVKLLLEHGATVNVENERKQTPLELAAAEGRVEVLKLLVNAKADIGYALLEVIESGNANAARVLIEGGADFSLTKRDGSQPLHIAAARGMTNIVELLLKAGAPANTVNQPVSGGSSPLHLAAESGRDTIVALLLQAKAPINLQDNSGRTALYLAVAGKHTAVAARLLRAGADPNLAGTYTLSENTPVALAASRGTTELLAMLLSAGADPNKAGRDAVTTTPLHLAAGSGQAANVQLLLKAGAKVTVAAGWNSALHSAARSDSAAQVIALLAKAGSPVDWKGEDDKTPLHVAAEEKKVEAVKALLAAGASVRAIDKCGQTPLWLAVATRYQDEELPLAIAEALIAAGADVNARSTCAANRTILELADERGHLKLRRLLVAKGAR